MPKHSRHTRPGPMRFAAVLCTLVLPLPADAGEPLSQRIDRLVESGNAGAAAPRCSDAAFLRRVWLDLNGSIPTSAQARAFLDDKSPDKRQKLVEMLLDSPRYARHMARVFDVMLMERARDKYIGRSEWEQYLLDSFRQNKPWDRLAREILAADGADEKLRPAAKFYLEREVEPNRLTRDVGRVFFGQDLQCAQCHDHPLIDNYFQQDYYGLYAFLSRSSLFQDAKQKKKAFLAETAEGRVSFTSVFTGLGGRARPRLPGEFEIDEPRFPEGEEYEIKPAKNVRPVPKYSRRERLAKEAADGSNRAFNRNIVNRLWAHMTGRGLVDPVDLHHPDNPPTHPRLLDLLADEFVGMNYDIKAMLRIIALTETYQRSIDVPAEAAAAFADAEELLPELQAEHKRQLAVARASEKAVMAIDQELYPLTEAVTKAEDELEKAKGALAEARKAADPAVKALNTALKQLEAKKPLAEAAVAAAARLQNVARRLSEEKPLAQAAQTFQSRAQKLHQEVTALEMTVEAKRAAARPLQEKRDGAEKSLAEAARKLDEAKKAAAPLKRRLVTADVKRRADLTTANALEQRIEALETLTDYSRLASVIEPIKTEVEALRSEVAAKRRALNEINGQLSAGRAALAEKKKGLATAETALETLRKDSAAVREAGGLLEAALAKIEAARGKLPDETQVAETATALREQVEKLKQRAGRLEEEVEHGQAAFETAQSELKELQQQIETKEDEQTAAARELAKLEAQFQDSSGKLQAKQSELDEAYDAAAERFSRRFAASSLRPLSPEQLAWSMMTASGVYQRQRAAEAAALKKKNPEQTPDAAAVEEAVYRKLKGNEALFVRLFAAAPGQPQGEFFATADQALFFANGSQLRGWLAPSAGGLTDRLNKLSDAKALAEELYLSVLTRRPSDEEMAVVARYLSGRKQDRLAAIQELAWALLTSNEFRFNH